MQETTDFLCQTPERLDKFLSEVLETTRNQVLSLIKDGHVNVDSKVVTKPGQKLKADQKIHIDFPPAVITEPLEIDFDVEILFEDDDLLVINKPKGLTVHPAPSVKEATLVDWLKHKGIRLSTISGVERHGIALTRVLQVSWLWLRTTRHMRPFRNNCKTALWVDTTLLLSIFHSRTILSSTRP